MKILLLLAALLLPVHEAAAPPAEPSARQVLTAWDADRSAAWAAGDVRALRALYTRGSIAGERDASMLQGWVDRGRTVTGLRMQVLSMREVSGSEDRLVVDVVDRVVGAESDGLPLPADTPTSRRLVFRHVEGEWLLASVR